jgi:hypothetical protein
VIVMSDSEDLEFVEGQIGEYLKSLKDFGNKTFVTLMKVQIIVIDWNTEGKSNTK